MQNPKISKLLLSAAIFALAACSSGGGGTSVALNTGGTSAGSTTTGSTSGATTGSTGGTTTGSTSGTTTGSTSGSTTGNTTTGGTTTGSTSGSTTGNTSGSQNSTAGNTATGVSTVFANTATPNFSTGNQPAVGTVFPIAALGVLKIDTSSGATISGLSPTGTATLTFMGTNPDPTGAPPDLVFKLDVPGISLQDPRLVEILSGDEDFRALNYTFIGNWYRRDANSPNVYYDGVLAAGFQTPASAVPTSGSGTYLGDSSNPSVGGGVIGAVFSPCGGAICQTVLHGSASVTINFGSGNVAGTLGSMRTQSGQFGQTSLPWNDISLTGTLSGAKLSGTTSLGQYNPANLSSSASGTFSGTLNGPNAQELGAAFSLIDPKGPGGTVIAIGSIAATKQ